MNANALERRILPSSQRSCNLDCTAARDGADDWENEDIEVYLLDLLANPVKSLFLVENSQKLFGTHMNRRKIATKHIHFLETPECLLVEIFFETYLRY